MIDLRLPFLKILQRCQTVSLKKEREEGLSLAQMARGGLSRWPSLAIPVPSILDGVA